MATFADRAAGQVARRLEKRCGHICVIAFWAVVAVCGLVWGPKLLNEVTEEFEPPSGSKSEAAVKAFEQAFPEQAKTVTSLIYVEAPADGPTLLDPLLPGGGDASSVLCEVTNRTREYFGPSGPGAAAEMRVTGYCTVDPRLQAVAGASLVTMKGRASVIRLDCPKEQLNVGDMRAGHDIIKLVKELRLSYPALFIGPAGQATLGVEAMDGLKEDLGKMDLTIPLAFCVMAVMVRSCRLIVLPLLCLGVSFISALLAVYLVHKVGMTINSAAPTLMLAILVALSIDYALFLLTRFTEEITGGAKTANAVAVMLARSGKTIIGSGLTLCLCFVGLLAFPITLLQSVGVAIVAAVLVTMAVNLTLMPAFLLAFPAFFARSGSSRCCAARERPADIEAPQEATSSASSGLAGAAAQNAAAPLTVPDVPAKLPPWYRLARMATSGWSRVVALPVLLVVLIPGSIMLANMKHSGSMLMMVPRSADTPTTLRRLEAAFPSGMDSPYDLLLQPKAGGSVYEEKFLEESRGLVAKIAGLAGDGSQVSSPMYVSGSPGNNMSFGVLRPILNAKTDAICNILPMRALASQCLGLRYVANSTVNADRSAVVALVIIAHPMGSPEASAFTRRAREAIDDFMLSAKYVDAQLAGAGPVYADSVDTVYNLLPIVLGVTLVVVLSIVGLLYRSAGIGLRALLTIAFTIAFSFGVGMVIYQYGWLDSLGVSRFSKDGAFAWLVPPVCFSVILGLALDYDIFLVGRVVEFRLMGFSDRAAVELGLWKTGKVITAAGLIMAIAFAGLMLSDTAMLNQASAMLVSAVLVDTFIVRSLIVPAVMGAMGSLNWWPRRVGAGYRDAEDYVKGAMLLEQSCHRQDVRDLGTSLQAANGPVVPTA